MDYQELQKRSLYILNQLLKQVEGFYISKCPNCGNSAELINAIWEGNELKKVYLKCHKCQKSILKDSDIFDQSLAASISIKQTKFTDIYYHLLPKDSDVNYLGGLYTNRNWQALTILYDLINTLENDEIAEELKLMFCATAARVSRMTFINKYRLNKGNNPSGVWGEKRFWVPDEFVENSVLYYFRERIPKVVKAKQETNTLIGDFYRYGDTFNGYVSNALELGLPNESINYCFTDPPYGGSIRYLDLSTIWNVWLDCKIDKSQEIIIDSDKGLEEYEKMLEQAMREIHRILKKDAYLSVTFHSGDSAVWKSLLSACESAGFNLYEVKSEEPSKKSHNQLDMKGRVTSDFVLTFHKEELKYSSYDVKTVKIEVSDFVNQQAKQLISEKGAVTTAEIYDRVILAWLRNSGGIIRRSHFNITMIKLADILRRLGFKEGIELRLDYKGDSKELTIWP